MKVVCDGCQAKYKLTDGRLAGRKLKFRCRKCGNTIVIDGAELGHYSPGNTLELSIPAEGFTQESVAAFESSASEWYLSINGEPYGPCTTEQMASMLGDGQVPWDTYVWREGYPEWKAASDSRTLVRAVNELSAQVERDASLDREHDDMQAERGYDDDWMASMQPGAPDAPDASHHGHDAEYRGADDRLPLGDEPTKVGYVDPNTGRLAYGGEDASGLIDIRALSALAGSQRNPRFSARRSPSGAYNPEDDRFSLTSPGERLRGTNGVDTLAPVARTRSVAGKAVPMAILGGSALIAVAAFAAIYSTPAPGESRAAIALHDEQAIAPPHETTQIAEPAAPSGVVPAPEPAAPPGAANPAPADHAEVDSAAAAATEAAAIKERRAAMALARSERAKRAAEAVAAQADATKGDAAAAAAPGSATPAASAVGAAANGPAPNAPAAAEPPAPSTAGAKPATGNARSIDELLEGAVTDSDGELDSVLASAGKTPEHAEAAEAAQTATATHGPDGAALQAMPTREQVLAAMHAVEPDVRSCTEGQSLDSYTAAAAFSVTGATGRVGSVRVTGIQGPVGSCIARAVRNAIFPPFAKSQLRINFPFRLGP